MKKSNIIACTLSGALLVSAYIIGREDEGKPLFQKEKYHEYKNEYSYLVRESHLYKEEYSEFDHKIDGFQKLYIKDIKGEYGVFETSNGTLYYIPIKDLELLPKDYIEIDLSEDILKVYKNKKKISEIECKEDYEIGLYNINELNIDNQNNIKLVLVHR